MGPPLIYLGEGGSGSEYSREILRCGHTGDTALRVIKLGGDPPHGTVPEGGGVPPPGGAANHGEDPKSTYGWGMGILPDNKGAK